MSAKTYLKNIGEILKAGNATEHTYRPALKQLLEDLMPGATATNEPKRVQCGAPDYIVTNKDIPIGYVEAKDVGTVLGEVESSEQLRRYRDSLGNLILTDYIEFRWYVRGEHRLTARLGKIQSSGILKANSDGEKDLIELIQGFQHCDVPVINSPKELAVRMAALANLIRSIIGKTFSAEGEKGALHGQMEAFQKVLMQDMTPVQFGDMYAQTICYGLFAARCNSAGGKFTRAHAAYDLPKTNPFLRKLFGHIAGPELDERIVWAVDDLAELLNRADISAILKDFGRRTRQEDPIVHFYETFLAAYDPAMREARGVYYTPEPVVSYIVRSVDEVLKEQFKLKEGLAHSGTVKFKRPLKLSKKGETKYETVEAHRVQVLDPATGTGTFLYGAVGLIYESFLKNKGLWPGYVADHLLPRIYGFELLMAPYAVAHMKLGLQLRDLGYKFHTEERLRVYLTNTLEEAHEMAGVPLFTQWLAEEANSASKVKQEAPIMVVMGNPPYSGHSANTGEWIAGLLRGMDGVTGKKTGNYFEVDGEPLGERNPKWLNDDYVKFIRFAQWRIEQTGYGVLAFVTNHGYLANPTFRGMRQSLMQAFDEIYVLDLHGNSKRKEKTPEGEKDENVFDIQQGVAIALFIKREKKKADLADVYHADIYGLRDAKYEYLLENDIATTEWEKLEPETPFYLFVPQNKKLYEEYAKGWSISEIMPVSSVGIVTARDDLTIQWNKEDVWATVNDFAHLNEAEAREKYNLGKDARDWKVSLAQEDLKTTGLSKDLIVPILYRPFDIRSTYYTGNSRGFQCMPRGEVMRNMLSGENVALISARSNKSDSPDHFFCSRYITEAKTGEASTQSALFPLYIYGGGGKADLFAAGSRQANLSPAFVKALSAALEMKYISDGKGDLKKTFGPEDVLHYAYAVFYSEEYRSRYAEFLKIDFPRLPITTDSTLFRRLCMLGHTLIQLHLMDEEPKSITAYPKPGDNSIEKVRFVETENGKSGQVWINASQHFDGVPPEVWSYQIGGYPVCQKWLNYRKGRKLTYEDLKHFQNMVAALAETIKAQRLIDEVIADWLTS